jgi:hypothetical protein
MKHRIAVWAGMGFLIAGFWAVYFFQMAPITATERMWTLSGLTAASTCAGHGSGEPGSAVNRNYA